MSETKKIVEKHKKYIMQFPEGTSAEKQGEYLKKVEEKMDSGDRFVVIDPKIKVYESSSKEEITEITPDAPKTEEVKEDGKATTEEAKATESPAESPAAQNDAPAAKPESTTESSNASESKVTIEKVESDPEPEPKPEDHPMIAGNEGKSNE